MYTSNVTSSNKNILHKLLSLKIDIILCLHVYIDIIKSLLKYYISTKRDFKIQKSVIIYHIKQYSYLHHEIVLFSK